MSEDLTPIHMRCTLTMSCPSVHRRQDGRLEIRGELCLLYPPRDDEATIIIPPDLLDTFVEEKTGSLRERIKELEAGIGDTLGMIRVWAKDQGFPVQNSACYNRLSEALYSAPVSSADETEPARSAES